MTISTRMELPRLALSVRQPFAWAIIHACKNIENRDWKPTNSGLRFRGRVAIHASKGMTREEYESFNEFMMDDFGGEAPAARELIRGAIVGSVEIIDVVRSSSSPWFFGPIGLVLRDPLPCTPIPCVGQLGFFEWREADPSVMAPPARWMLEAA